MPTHTPLAALDHATGWINSQPLTATRLRGNVVVIHFWTYTCINWLRSLPHVRAWSEQYADHGLVTIGVHTPEFEFERRRENVERAAHDLGVNYPVALDTDYAIWRGFDNHYWPALYVLDAHGQYAITTSAKATTTHPRPSSGNCSPTPAPPSFPPGGRRCTRSRNPGRLGQPAIPGDLPWITTRRAVHSIR